jgi:hypothetical protein
MSPQFYKLSVPISIILVIAITVAANAYTLTQKKIEEFIKTLNWGSAKVTEQKEGNSFTKIETLPNAVRFSFSDDIRDIFLTELGDKLTGNNRQIGDPRLTCYSLDNDSLDDTLARALIKNDYRTFLNGGETLLHYKNFPVYIQFHESRMVCSPDISQYNKQSLAKAYNDNSYAFIQQHNIYQEAFKFTGAVKTIENRIYPVVVFDIEPPDFSGFNIINMTRLACSGIPNEDIMKIKTGKEVSVIVWNLMPWDSPYMQNLIQYFNSGDVVASCEIFSVL